MKRFLLLTAALAAAVCAFVAFTIAPAHRTLTQAPDGTVPGILHVHTQRSDGRGTPDQVAAAAARAGLKFVVFTDHGDATRTPDPPTYRSGVLCLDGVEISTNGGHYIALGMPVAPYPLGGEARDVVDDVRRLGGFGIVAHPDSPKPQLQWTEWTAPFDAMETVNLDTSWRLRAQWPGWRSRARLFEALVDYPVRPAETIASLLQGTTALYRWEALARRRRVVTIAGADAHARLGLRGADPGDSRYSIPLPSYEASFRTMSVHVRPDRPLTGDAAQDAALLLRALRAGHLYTAIDGFATPPSFDFSATNDLGTVHEGDELGVGGPITLRVRTNAPPEYTVNIWNGTQLVATPHHEQEVTVTVPADPAVYWVDIRSNGKTPTTWIASNAIYVRGPQAAFRQPVRPPATRSRPIFDGRSTAYWLVEHDAGSTAAVDTVTGGDGPELRFQFGLGPNAETHPYVSLVADRPESLAGDDRLTFTARADRPMRVSVQLRGVNAQGATERWSRSVYVDTVAQERTVYFDDLTPVGTTETWQPNLATVKSILLVLDTTNTKAGTSGRLWIRSPVLQQR